MGSLWVCHTRVGRIYTEDEQLVDTGPNDASQAKIGRSDRLTEEGGKEQEIGESDTVVIIEVKGGVVAAKCTCEQEEVAKSDHAITVKIGSRARGRCTGGEGHGSESLVDLGACKICREADIERVRDAVGNWRREGQ